MLFLKGGNMAPIKRKDRNVILLKTFILAVACLSLAGFLSCSGTDSTTSAGGGSGTGTEFRTRITVGEPVIPLGGTTGVTAVVRDSHRCSGTLRDLCLLHRRTELLSPGR